MSTRYQKIIDAYTAALDGRDANSVSIDELLPSIFDAVPYVEIREIIAALHWEAERQQREADQLRRYGNAKYGNVGKKAEPGDGTISFPRRVAE
jgi:hypothetical protein